MRTSRTDPFRLRPAGAAPGRLRGPAGLASAKRMLAAGLAAAGLMLSLGGAPTDALDASARMPVPDKSYRSAREALRSGVRDYNAGDKEGAVRALEYAAGQGQTLALWKLGRMYADGDGVPHDDLKAFEYFSKIADENPEEAANSPNSGVVASAFTSLGGYFLEGIPGSYVRPNPERAYDMFNYAASYFGDSNAQYNLARLYLEGHGVSQDPRQAARWFNLAAEKGHRPAQALLGDMLFKGIGVQRQPVRGLTWLAVARSAGQGRGEEWIATLYDKAWADATESERAEALSQAQASATTGSTRRRR